MAKKSREIFKLTDNDLKPIMKGLQRSVGEGKIKFDELISTQIDCPFCGMEGTKERPCLMVDRETLTWRSNCCGRRNAHDGGPINYIMLTKTKGKDSLKEAVKYLKEFVRG
jgi:hypothetical protein